MKAMRKLTAIGVTLCILGGVLAAIAAEKKAETKVKPYVLKTCAVSGDKLGEMGKPFVFTNDNREIKLCCKSCLKDFKKEPAKYVKKIEEAESKEKASKR